MSKGIVSVPKLPSSVPRSPMSPIGAASPYGAPPRIPFAPGANQPVRVP
jgi:hypothetical protein